MMRRLDGRPSDGQDLHHEPPSDVVAERPRWGVAVTLEHARPMDKTQSDSAGSRCSAPLSALPPLPHFDDFARN